MAYLISFKGIAKKFGNKTIINNLDLNINRDEIIALVGKSGSGKSTLFKIFLGLYKPDLGKIIYDGEDLVNNPKKIQHIVGFVSQENSFYEQLSVIENLVFFANLYHVSKLDISHRSDYLLKLVNLFDVQNMLALKLSGGMKRRLEFAISLIHNPSILILDEPFTGLDIQICDDLWEVINDIKYQGVTVIVSTHILSTAQKHVQRVVFLHDKKICLDLDLKSELLKNPNFSLEDKFYGVISK
jgi:ABC-2 type transport system ATP-binding protein